MAKLQPCPKCGAQFDVSAMAAGTAFTCGACGAVVTAGAAPAPSRTPPVPARAAVGAAASRAIPAPAGKTAGGRGPQYVPAERHREPAPAGGSRGRDERVAHADADRDDGGGSARHSRGDRRGGDRGDRGGPRKSGLSLGALVGIAVGGLAVVIGAILLVSKKDKTPSGDGGNGKITATGPGSGSGTAGGGTTATPGMDGTASPTKPGPDGATPGETASDVEKAYALNKHPTNVQLRSFFERFQAAGASGASRAKELANKLVLEDPDYEPAHVLLGHKKFDHVMPDIAFREYNYIQIVEDAITQKWFDDDESFAQAQVAWEKTDAHQRRMEGDSTFRALDGARREISQDHNFKDYNYEAIFASPYLICYSSEERFTKADMEKLPYKKRIEKRTELEKKRGQFAGILAEKGLIYTQLYKEFLKRYQDSCGLHPLMDEYGGRADLPPGKRSNKDGIPLIIWIFSDRKAWDEFHAVVKGEPANPNVAGYFSPGTGWVYLYDEEGDREFEINKTVHEGTHQLEHWFQKQKRDWGQPQVPQSFFGEGFAEYMGAVAMAPDRTLTFHGINRPRVTYLKEANDAMKSQGKKLPIFPLKDLAGFEGYESVGKYGSEHKIPNPLGFFYAQSWAFVYFLNEFSSHKYQAKFTGFLNDMLMHPKPSDEKAHGYAFDHLKSRLGLKSAEDWAKLQKEFEGWYLKDLLVSMDLGKIPPAPTRENWPGYKQVDPIDPRKDLPAAAAAPTEPAKTTSPGATDPSMK